MDDWKAIARKMRKYRCGAKRIAARVGKTEDEIKDFFKAEKRKQKEKAEKFSVFENLDPTTHIQEWVGNQVLTFGLIGDTHINSKYTQLTYLKNFYEVCSRRGVTDIYHTGDIDEGEQMRVGHQYECYTQGAGDHISEIVANYPHFNGITTSFITGNHDASVYKKCGIDIGETIATKRSDMKYLGRDCARIEITPNCILELRHPWDGTAYALSYKSQKMIEGMEADSKPNILAIGHYHKIEYVFYRNIHCFQTGCFQMQTPFTRGKGISVHLGGWIVTVEVDKLGHVQRIVPEMIPFYKGITSDYKNWGRSLHD
jgi:predicted phosphodiesterase